MACAYGEGLGWAELVTLTLADGDPPEGGESSEGKIGGRLSVAPAFFALADPWESSTAEEGSGVRC